MGADDAMAIEVVNSRDCPANVGYHCDLVGAVVPPRNPDRGFYHQKVCVKHGFKQFPDYCPLRDREPHSYQRRYENGNVRLRVLRMHDETDPDARPPGAP